jgi:hypothetical protein
MRGHARGPCLQALQGGEDARTRLLVPGQWTVLGSQHHVRMMTRHSLSFHGGRFVQVCILVCASFMLA